MLKAMLVTAIVAAGLTPMTANAFPGTPQPSPGADAGVIEVYAGCGIYGHRGPYGGCRPGGQAGGYIPGRGCPAGWHVGPYGRHCFRNRY